MRTICLAATLLVALSVVARDSQQPLLISHNRVDGPMGGEYHVEDLQVFSSGKVLYAEEVTTSLGQQPVHGQYELQMEAEELQRLSKLLDSHEVRSLPKKIPSKTKPIDFFWQKSFQINHPEGTQKVQIENFYPFLNLNGSAYPRAVIDLECALQDIQMKAAKRQNVGDEGNWCRKLAAKHAR